MWKDHPDRTTIGGIAVIMVCVAAWSARSQFLLAQDAGAPVVLCWVLPVATDATVVVATRVYLSPQYTSSVRHYAGMIALPAAALSVFSAAVYAALPPGVMTEKWGWLKPLVGAIPSLCLAAIVHLASMLPGGLIASRSSSSVAVPAPAAGEDPEETPVAPVALHVVAQPRPSRAVGAPEWLREDMNAKEALFAYFDHHPQAQGVDADGFAAQYLAVKPSKGYGRKIRTEWKSRQLQASGE